MLTGVVPFDGESSQEIILKHLTADPDVSMLPQPYAYAIQKSLAKNPASRFRDCRELLRSIGWDLDASGLAVRASENVAHPSIPPVLQPVAGAALPVAKPIGNDHPTVAGNPIMQGVYGNPNAELMVSVQTRPVAMLTKNRWRERSNKPSGKLKLVP